MSMSKMMEIDVYYANGEEEDRIRGDKGKAVNNDAGGNSNRKQKRKADGSTLAEAAVIAAQGKFKGKSKGQFPPKKSKNQSDVLDQPCVLHTKKDEEGNLILPKHTTRQCRLLIQQFKQDQSSGKDPEKENDKEKDDFPEVQATLMIFAYVESRSRLKALVVDPVVEGVRLRKVLMDGGSGLNILYAETLKGMGIPMSRLSKSNMQFHGVIPRKKAKSLCQTALDVVFGSDKNFHKEKLTFEVVDF
ncbi:hypothetical protein ZWY2020_059142 [Hordeum vulgare]|nr:hypothetical protein ZWY2020_059142 [Hordeum vulgare]